MSHEIAHITQHQLHELQRRLRARARALASRIEQDLRSEALVQEAFDASSSVEAAVDTASIEREGWELTQVEHALARLESGLYGLCVECGAAIPWVRLDAVPEAARCVQCESEREHRWAKPPSL